MSEFEYFTLVFKGNIAAFKGNPLKTETPFGVPFAAGLGDAFDKLDTAKELIEALLGLELGSAERAMAFLDDVSRSLTPEAGGE